MLTLLNAVDDDQVGVGQDRRLELLLVSLCARKRINIHARHCLDKCDHAPVVMVHTPDGVAVIDNATAESIAEAVEQTCG